MGAKEEAILELISLVGLGVEGGSQITNGMAVKTRGGPKGILVGHLVDLEVSRGLLCPWGVGRKRGCCWEADRPPGKKWSVVILFQTTILVSNSSDSISLTRMGLAAVGSLIGKCLAQP